MGLPAALFSRPIKASTNRLEPGSQDLLTNLAHLADAEKLNFAETVTHGLRRSSASIPPVSSKAPSSKSTSAAKAYRRSPTSKNAPASPRRFGCHTSPLFCRQSAQEELAHVSTHPRPFRRFIIVRRASITQPSRPAREVHAKRHGECRSSSLDYHQLRLEHHPHRRVHRTRLAGLKAGKLDGGIVIHSD